MFNLKDKNNADLREGLLQVKAQNYAKVKWMKEKLDQIEQRKWKLWIGQQCDKTIFELSNSFDFEWVVLVLHSMQKSLNT